MQHFIRVYTVCKSMGLGISLIQRLIPLYKSVLLQEFGGHNCQMIFVTHFSFYIASSQDTNDIAASHLGLHSLMMTHLLDAWH